MRARALLLALALFAGGRPLRAADPPANPPRPQVSGIYPHLAMFNNEGECGTGAVVPWADRLWVITYGPHLPNGSSDKLYEITPELRQTVRPESVGGTPANRMIHRESKQLFIGPYAIDSERKVRVIPPKEMFGRLTGNARHLTAPADKIYYATMEEGFYEVDVRTLAVTQLYEDGNRQKDHGGSLLPGYHGKGLYSGQGRLIYANNGENSPLARQRPDIESGVLAEWTGPGKDWHVVRRNQFTEVTGPGGIYGNDRQDDPVWSVGWDHRSLILMVLDGGKWHSYRLPKASHSYDGAHGWNTEWPRIREIGEDDLLMTMHGAFWRFPRNFAPANAKGIAPRSTYLKVVGDFCRWQDRIVLGCDDTAHNEFLNKRRAKGEIPGPQSQSNLWFLEPKQLDGFGPVIGRGALWLEEDVAAAAVTEPYLIAGYPRRHLSIGHQGSEPATIEAEIDRDGTGSWTVWKRWTLAPGEHRWEEITESGEWLRLSSRGPLKKVTATFHFSEPDPRTTASDPIFAGLTEAADSASLGGLVRARDRNKRTLSVVRKLVDGESVAQSEYYELDESLTLSPVNDPATLAYTAEKAAIPDQVLTADSASVIFVDDGGHRWRLPRSQKGFDGVSWIGPQRVAREVATERDLFSAHGTFYELPAENAGGFAKVRPVATHGYRIHDFCSYRGLFVMTGLSPDLPEGNPHIIPSADRGCALWVGAIDDVWRMGKPRGYGGPWMETAVAKDAPSDPYLMTGYDRKTLTLTNSSRDPVRIRVELDITGSGTWRTYRELAVQAGETVTHEFPAGFEAYWLRTTADHDGTFSAQLTYE